MNLSGIPLDNDCINVLSKGLNFGIAEDFDLASFEIDLYKGMRKVNLHKFFSTGCTNKERKSKKEGEIPTCIGPLGFSAIETTTEQEKECFRDLEELEIESRGDSPPKVVEIEESHFSGGNRSTFSPPVEPGGAIDIFTTTVMNEIKALIYPKAKNNLTDKEKRALAWLKNRPDLIVKRADKGGSTVVLSSTQYNKEALRQLNTPEVYTRLASDPTLKTMDKLRSLLRVSVEEGLLSEQTANKLLPLSPKKPKWYYLPKVHKSLTDPPGRPIVAGIEINVTSILDVFDVSLFFPNLFYTQQNNQTSVTWFFLLGFQGSQNVRLSLFCLFLVVYWGTICGNLLIITLVSTSKILHTPMYFFISQLSISDILLSTDIVPNLLHILLNNGAAITFTGCITQFYFFCVSETCECLLLAVMSYDRYVAICNPLRYNSIMTQTHCVILGGMCWFFGLTIILSDNISLSILHFCGPNIVDHFYCDLVPLLAISCSDPFIVQLELYLLSFPVAIIPSVIIIRSYVSIVYAIFKIPSSSGRQKAFSTCSSHLIVVSIFYWTLFSVYVFPKRGQSSTISKILSLLYTVFTPLINPIIYSLRNKDIKTAVHGSIQKLFFSNFP
ncbi:olfactory receptor 11H4-like [Dendropsophus ebraccatus]|uniref:olfactory receptor 11H4-like n=1 Tax=Dendropsophus ebraccatus TaxID=150705 RepID=UPI003831FA9E